MNKFLLHLLALLFVTNMVCAQTEKIDTATVSKIKDEGMNRSQVMSILSMLTDIHGPRLTNSPGYKRAADYAKNTLTSWGVENVSFDVWNEDFGKRVAVKKVFTSKY